MIKKNANFFKCCFMFIINLIIFYHQVVYDFNDAVPFLCAICGNPSNTEGLGDLFGPYYSKERIEGHTSTKKKVLNKVLSQVQARLIKHTGLALLTRVIKSKKVVASVAVRKESEKKAKAAKISKLPGKKAAVKAAVRRLN